MSQEDYSRVLKRQLGCCGLGTEVGVSAYVCAAFMATADAAGAFLSLLNPEYMYVCVYIYTYIYIYIYVYIYLHFSYFNEEMT